MTERDRTVAGFVSSVDTEDNRGKKTENALMEEQSPSILSFTLTSRRKTR